MPLEEFINQVLNLSKREFSRLRYLDFDNGTISTDCMGLIYLLLENQNAIPDKINRGSKVIDFYKLALTKNSSLSILDIKKYDLLMWRKDHPPSSGDTGHILLAMATPKKLTPSQYSLQILETSRFSQGPILRQITLHTSQKGKVEGVQWHPEQKKVKKTTIINYRAFKRQLCANCQLTTLTCLCQHLPKTPWSLPPFRIIQDSREAKVALRSTRILELSFIDSQGLYIGPEKVSANSVLVYPDKEARELSTPSDFESLKGHELILLDGSWKQVKGILLKNPRLQQLKKVKFTIHTPPRYKIRKAPSEDHYSTLESFSYLWEKIYPKSRANAHQLNDVFSKMIEKQIELMGRETYEKNYAHYPGHSS